ncbi:ArsR/SmtB family transcription factor [Roseovarius albus]|nr:helix-turn-helix transcriptional regulator [Roseovarius albus]
MHDEPPMARIGAMISAPARAIMLTELFDGRALTMTELAGVAGVSASTASEHLAQLLEGGFVTREKSGRHNYYRLASPQIAHALEQLVAQTAHVNLADRPGKRPRTPIQQARMCYDHIAGHLGVAIADALVSNGALIPLDNDYELTPQGEALLGSFGADIPTLRHSKRLFARQCLDWSERRHHVAGVVGATIADLAFANGWIERARERRVLHVTPKGQSALKKHLGLNIKSSGDLLHP